MLPGRAYSPIDYLLMAWRRRWVIVACVVLGAYAALIVSSRLQAVYQSEMLIQIVPQRVPDSYVRSTVTMQTENRIDALSQQVKSRTELERLIEQLNLYPTERGVLPMEDIVARMRNRIDVELVRTPRARDGADAFFVRFTYPDAEVATRVTEKLGALFIDFNARDRGTLADATNDFLQTQLAEARRQLEEREKKLEAFRQRNAGRLPSQLEFNMQAINNAQLQLQSLVEGLARDRDRKLMLERLLADSEREPAPVAAAAAPPLESGDTGPAGATTAQQLAAAREQLARLQLRLQPEHPDMMRAARLVRELEARATQEAQNKKAPVVAEVAVTPEEAQRRERLAQMRAEIESLARQVSFRETEERRLRETIEEYRLRIEQVPGVESEWIALTRDYETQQSTYRDLLSKSEQSRVAADLERQQVGEQFRVLDPARPPVRPIGVARLQVNILGTMAGLGFGVLLAALLEFRDRTFRSGLDVVNVLKLPVVAFVPTVTGDAERASHRRRRLAISTAVVLVASGAGYGAWALQLWRYIK
jgi:polysaccharide chain length determinant protein (PEP-CTERM system associated)